MEHVGTAAPEGEAQPRQRGKQGGKAEVRLPRMTRTPQRALYPRAVGKAGLTLTWGSTWQVSP